MSLHILSFLAMYLYQEPLIFISLSVLCCISFSPSLSFFLFISLSLCLAALTANEACRDGTHYELAYMAGSCVCVCVCSCLVNSWNAHSGPFSRFWERTHTCIFSYVFVLPVCIILLKDAQCCQLPTYT